VKSFVIDCSSALSLFIPDEANHKYRDKIFKLFKDARCVVPSIWLYEVNNVLLSCLKRGRLEKQQVYRIIESLNKLPLEVENSNLLSLHNDTYDLALKNNLSFYDASYVNTTIRNKSSFATLDKKLAACAVKLNIEVV
jgi:predicted nucleic acid-binding protein